MPAPDSSDSPRPSARSRFVRGIRLGLPIFLGYVPIGAAFGILARSAGFTPLQAVSCSGLVFAGAGQFVGLSLMQARGDVVAIVLATGIINLRHILFGAALSPYLKRAEPAQQAALAFTLTDETFAVNVEDCREGRADPVSMLGVGAVSWVGWVSGTTAGALLTGLIGDPSRWGVDFAMPAMFTALLVAQATERKYVVVAAIAGALALALSVILPGKWFVIGAAVAAATVGAVVYR
jgi:4-azaleucine resistance transporter AzlC